MFLWIAQLAHAQSCGAWAEPVETLFETRVGIDEASGLAASRRSPGRYFLHNDSGRGETLFSFELGDPEVRLHSVPDAKNEDWEDLAAGPCRGGGDCLFIADTGDNTFSRPTVDVWVVKEPDSGDAVLKERWSLAFPGAPEDVETLLVHPCTGASHLVTRANDGLSNVYRIPSNAGRKTRELELVTSLQFGEPGMGSGIVTGGDWNVSGDTVVLRTHTDAWVWRADVADPEGHWDREPERLPLLSRPDGEAITFGLDGSLVAAGEGLLFHVQTMECMEPVAEPVCDAAWGCSTGGSGRRSWGFAALLLGALARRRTPRVLGLTLLGAALAACKPAPAGPETEADADTDTDTDTDTDADTDVAHPVAVTQGALVLQEVSRDGGTAAYLDGEVLYTVALDGSGSPVERATLVQRGRYVGDYLVAFQGLSADQREADTALFALDDATLAPLGDNVRMRSLDASPDGRHLYHEVVANAVFGTEAAYLDAVEIIPEAKQKKARFSADSNWLVVGLDAGQFPGPGDRVVRSWPTDGGAPNTLASGGAANETRISNDSTSVVVGANEDINVVDVTIHPIDGGAGQLLAVGGDDTSFRFTDDDAEVLYLIDTETSGAIEAVSRTGGTPRTIKASGALDMRSVSQTHLLYVVAQDIQTGLDTLAIIGLDGTGDRVLGSQAREVGFTSTGAHVLYRDEMDDVSGRLISYDVDTAAFEVLAEEVVKIEIADDTTAVSLDVDGVLRRHRLGGATVALATGVSRFDVVPTAADSPGESVAYSDAVGLWLLEL